jgi:hypothetical protein
LIMARPWRRPVLLLFTLAACSQLEFEDWGPTNVGPSGNWSCDYPTGPAAPSGPSYAFTYVCPLSPDGGVGSSNVGPDAGGALPYEVDPFCAVVAEWPLFDSATIPTVAVGAPFQLAYELVGDAGGPEVSTAIAAAVPADAPSTAAGFSVSQPGFMGFLAWQGADVAGYMHILARSPVSLGLSTIFPLAINAAGLPFPDGSTGQPLSLGAGSVQSMVAFLRADDGTMLAGASAPCTFESSAPQVLSVQSRGVVAVLTAIADGSAALSAQCGILSASVLVQIAGSTGDADLEASDEAEAGPSEAGDDGWTARDAGLPDGDPGDSP